MSGSGSGGKHRFLVEREDLQAVIDVADGMLLMSGKFDSPGMNNYLKYGGDEWLIFELSARPSDGHVELRLGRKGFSTRANGKANGAALKRHFVTLSGVNGPGRRMQALRSVLSTVLCVEWEYGKELSGPSWDYAHSYAIARMLDSLGGEYYLEAASPGME